MTLENLKQLGFKSVEIPLTRGMWTIVDIDDIDFSNGRWCAAECDGRYYASCRRDYKHIYMHRLIANAQPGKLVDHKDGDSLNNRRFNLRQCSDSQNNWNRGANRKRGNSPKGVYFDSKRHKFYARIGNRFLGYFISEGNAIERYNAEALKIRGEFAYLNPAPPSSLGGTAQ